MGVVLNVMSAIVWSMPEMRSTTAMYMIALSVFDGTLLTIDLCFELLSNLYRMVTGTGRSDWDDVNQLLLAITWPLFTVLYK